MSQPVAGGFDIYTNGERIGVTTKNAPMPYVGALLHLDNFAVTCGLRVTSHWTGGAGNPYRNNDCSLYEVFNDVQSSSHNLSWAGSFCNAYNKIPEDVTDTGTRVGAIGWATSVNHNGYTHAGTLNEQIGLKGVAGFQGNDVQSPSTAKINRAIGVQGTILQSSAGTRIEDARAGEFICDPDILAGQMTNAIGVYSRAEGGSNANFSFYGAFGDLFNACRTYIGSLLRQSSAMLSIRANGNSIEFGHADTSGYGSTIGATYSHGFPFIAFSAETDPTGNTFTTRGKAGSVIRGDLAGGIVFGRLPSASASGQAIVESLKINNRGNLVLSRNPPSVAIANGETGEVAVDANYIYVCTAPNTWKRAALSSW